MAGIRKLYASLLNTQATVENTSDISIGKDKWIKWVDWDSNAVVCDIDVEITTTEPFWRYLETQCESACCGIGAYAFWTKDILNAKTLLGNPNIKNEFVDLKEKVEAINGNVVCSDYLNNLFDKNVFIQLLDHIISNL
ncbi:hypothetical protein EZ428_13115 [Pedobacter frigiditerrae]|uniref:Uncharacterized protein n=1 Tax=Pedobacter frigiditerrae TaxID=2530452 RepID=A0A4R0MT55_9SPHI|nr:hypothetical protein EZ428_13115 [Pedobacter frigiditerrae]